MVTQFISIQRDITQRKEDEVKLKEREERLRAILNTATSSIITIDKRGTIVSANPAAERVFGYTQAEFLGNNVRMLMPPPYHEEHDSYLERYERTHEPRIIGIGREVIARRKDGTFFPVELAISEVDHLGFFTGVLIDVSERKRLQRHVLEIAAEEQRRIGHELHDGTGQELTGLAFIASALLGLLSDLPPTESPDGPVRPVPETKYSQLRGVAESLCQRLVEANRHVHQLSYGIMPVQIDAEALRSALQELAASITSAGGVACVFECRSPVVVSDNTVATHLYRIAQEALNNAVRHANGTEIRISLERRDGRIVLTVSDNGVGIDLSKSARRARADDTGGLGLGTMEYRAGIIGGTLRVAPRPGGGTVVTCEVFETSGRGE